MVCRRCLLINRAEQRRGAVFNYLVVNRVKLRENNSVDEPRFVRHGVIGQSLIKLDLW